MFSVMHRQCVSLGYNFKHLQHQPSPLDLRNKTTTHLQVSALGATELLEVEVQHDGHPTAHVRSQEGLLDLCRQVVESGEGLGCESEVGPTLTLVLHQLVHTRLL